MQCECRGSALAAVSVCSSGTICSNATLLQLLSDSAHCFSTHLDKMSECCSSITVLLSVQLHLPNWCWNSEVLVLATWLSVSCYWIFNFLTGPTLREPVKHIYFISYDEGLLSLSSVHTQLCCQIQLADDTTVIDQISNKDEWAHGREEEDLTLWCHDNNLCLNVIETKEVIVDLSTTRENHTAIPIDGTFTIVVSGFLAHTAEIIFSEGSQKVWSMRH